MYAITDHPADLPFRGTRRIVSASPRTPETLLREVALRADRAAFAELFQRFAPSIKGYLMRGGASSSQADDLVQDVMFAVWHKAGTFDPARATAATWIFAIARNRRIDALRRERHFEPLEDDVGGSTSGPSIEAVLAAANAAEGLRRAVERLPKEQSLVLREAYWGDKSLAAIAAAQLIPIGTVKSRVRLALERLRGRFGHGNDP